MNSSFPAPLVGGFEVLEVPSDPYHGTYDRSCSCENCATDSANPMFFEYFSMKSSNKMARSDALVLLLIFVVSTILFCIITNLTAPK